VRLQPGQFSRDSQGNYVQATEPTCLYNNTQDEAWVESQYFDTWQTLDEFKAEFTSQDQANAFVIDVDEYEPVNLASLQIHY
jgi:hypothetical protein